jgi:hypothetical protein
VEPPSAGPPTGGGQQPSVPPTTGVPRLTAPPTKPSGEITVTGQVEFLEIEGGCLVLRAGSQTYELKGVDRETARHGARLVVRGRVRTDLMTICQVGPVLEAIEARPA